MKTQLGEANFDKCLSLVRRRTPLTSAAAQKRNQPERRSYRNKKDYRKVQKRGDGIEN